MGTKNCLLGMEFGVRQDFENMSVFPLHFPGNGGPEYITLKEAIERGVFVVAEVSVGGSVPELMVENKGDIAVLLLDGEEVAGAKQNRILNTTVLIGPKSTTKIPVSCTEHGRWSYMTDVFFESGNQMSPALRKINMRGVNASLRTGRQFRSDQGAVWDAVACESAAAGVRSETGAMRDVFEAKKKVLDDYLKSFKLKSGQKGALVLIGGQVAGLDFVSREKAFGVLHAKLIKSYAMEAMLVGEKAKAGVEKGKKKGEEQGGKEGTCEGQGEKKGAGERPVKRGARARGLRPGEAAAREFLGRAAECGETPYESIGLGTSLRYEGESVIGSALAVNDQVIHMAFFKTTGHKAGKAERMASASARRGFRSF
jgi:hypothetical protein